MRQIKFRGKLECGNMWVYGLIIHDSIIKDMKERQTFLVKKDTIGQYTGLKDEDGKEIYDGDIVEDSGAFDDRYKYLCRYDEDTACFKFYSLQSSFCGFLYWQDLAEAKVIGNIHDNPELFNN